MISRKNVLQLAVLPFFALLALGSGSPKKSTDSSPTGAASNSSSTTTVTSAAAGKAKGNCFDAKRGACTETYNAYGVDSEKKLCDTMGGKWTDAAECARKDTLWGVCTQMDPISTSEIYQRVFYYNEGNNKNVGGAASKDACGALSGTWEVGPASNATGAGKAAPPAKAGANAKKK